jgi:putative ABC transport system permease protein
MRLPDLLSFASRSLVGARTRTLLMLLAMSIGVASVVLLTALGEGARRYVIGEFEQLGTDLLIMLPGRNETTGGPPPLFGQTPRDLTIDDTLALLRHPSIRRIAPISVGNAPVSYGSREREVNILGSTRDFFPVRRIEMGAGRILPDIPADRQSNVTVLGAKLKHELFGSQPALGRWVRINDRRFRVIGLLAPAGESLGTDLGDMAIIPVASAQALFDAPSLFRVLIQARSKEDIESARKAALETIRLRHDGEDDVTLITQDAMLNTFDRILRALTYTVAGIAGISLAVAGILIMNVMLVAVSQRIGEIGLIKALGGSERQVLHLFLVEAVMLAGAGALLGLLLAGLGIALMNHLYPSFPLAAPLWAPAAAAGVAVSTGLLFGVMPARRAARMDPVQALTGR